MEIKDLEKEVVDYMFNKVIENDLWDMVDVEDFFTRLKLLYATKLAVWMMKNKKEDFDNIMKDTEGGEIFAMMLEESLK